MTGHTAVEAEGIENWELSLKRANAARRTLVQNGIPAQKVQTVIGKGARELIDPDQPDAPENRRVAIVMLRMGNPNQASDANPNAPPSIFQD